MLPRIAEELDEGRALKSVNRTDWHCRVSSRVGQQRNVLLLKLRRVEAVHAETIDRGGEASELIVAQPRVKCGGAERRERGHAR